jgi:hypothetical protein
MSLQNTTSNIINFSSPTIHFLHVYDQAKTDVSIKQMICEIWIIHRILIHLGFSGENLVNSD